MLDRSAARILAELGPGDLVLDVGAGANPFERADWVIDLWPYEERGIYGAQDREAERFSPDTWVLRDICDPGPWPFVDDQFDFAVCSHTLEDVRDPVGVCAELSRVAKAGYIEVPSRLEEQSLGVQGPWAGWGHHHWLIDPIDGGLEFVFKHQWLHVRETDHFPPGFADTLAPEERVLQVWWRDAVVARERVFQVPAELDRYLADFVAPRRTPDGPLRRPLRRLGRRLAAR